MKYGTAMKSCIGMIRSLTQMMPVCRAHTHITSMCRQISSIIVFLL